MKATQLIGSQLLANIFSSVLSPLPVYFYGYHNGLSSLELTDCMLPLIEYSRSIHLPLHFFHCTKHYNHHHPPQPKYCPSRNSSPFSCLSLQMMIDHSLNRTLMALISPDSEGLQRNWILHLTPNSLIILSRIGL